MAEENRQHSLLDTTVPVLVPSAKELTEHVDEYLASLRTASNEQSTSLVVLPKSDGNVVISGGSSSSGPALLPGAAYMDAIRKRAVPAFDGRDGKALTQNSDVTYSATGDVLVDLFYSLHKHVYDVLYLLLGDIICRGQEDGITFTTIQTGGASHAHDDETFIQRFLLDGDSK